MEGEVKSSPEGACGHVFLKFKKQGTQIAYMAYIYLRRDLAYCDSAPQKPLQVNAALSSHAQNKLVRSLMVSAFFFFFFLFLLKWWQ